MLTHVDRVQVVVADRRATAVGYQRLLGAEIIREDRVRGLAVRRTVLQIGRSEVELLEPEGAGAAAEFLAHTKGGLFAAGFATADMARLRTHLAARGIDVMEEGGQLFVSPERLGLPGFRAVVSAATDLPAVGALRHLYEATLLVDSFATVVARVATVFGLDEAHFVPIRSAEYGYEGMLTLFHPDRLDRMEIITPNEPAKTMGRLFARRGACWYMCFAEADDLLPIRARLLEHAPTQWTGPRDSPTVDTLFIHPPALGGVMLGVSRTTFAWTWSGHPERVQPEVRA